MNHLLRKLMLCACIGGLALAVSGCRENEAARPEDPRPVRTAVAKISQVGEEIVQTGEIAPHIETDLGFQIGGRVFTRNTEVGRIVAKGELLATLARHDVENEVRAAEAEVTRAEAAEALAKSAFDRQRTLFDRQFVARVRLEEAEAGWREANARSRVAQSALETARNKLSYAELRAPDDGIVSAIAINPGQVVAAGQLAVKLASLRERDAVFNVSERHFITVPENVQVEVALAGAPSVRITGTFRDASPSADPATWTYRVRVALPNAPEAMTLGATVTGRVVLDGRPLFVLPASAVTSANGEVAVFVVDPARRELVRKTVIVGRYTASEVLVASGLAEGDAVVTAGVSRLRPGQKVAFETTSGEAAR